MIGRIKTQLVSPMFSPSPKCHWVVFDQAMNMPRGQLIPASSMGLPVLVRLVNRLGE